MSEDQFQRETEPVDALDPTGTLAELSAILVSRQTLAMMLEDIVGLAKARIPGVDEVSITVLEEDRPSTIAATGSLASDMDERQYAAGWGPCLAAAESGELLGVEDTAADERWPQFAEKAREVGVGSSLSAWLPTQQHLGGALNMYATTPNAFGQPSRELAQSFAAHASLALAQSFAAHASLALAQAYRYTSVANQAETLREAMRSRAVIEQAKGIFMAARQVDAQGAFDMLVRLSQTRHIKLRELAAQIVSQASGHQVEVDPPLVGLTDAQEAGTQHSET